jgi:predicted MFS family arabinose efflux permease
MVFLVNLARIVFAPLVKELIVQFQITEGTAGLIATLVWVGSALPRIPTGVLLTYVARHRVVLATGGVLTGASIFTASANTVPTLAAGALLMGLSSGVYFVAANPLVSELYPERVGRALGVHGTAGQLAAVSAAPIVTIALLFDWRWAFRGIGVLAALVTIALFLTTRETTLPQASVEDRDLPGALRREWPTVLLGIVILGSTGFVWQGLFNFYELYAGTKNLAGPTAKNTVTVVFAAGVPAFFISGRLADRLPHVPYVLAILTAFVGSVLTLTLVEGLVPVLAVTVVIGYAIHSLFPAMDTFLLDTLPDETRGSAYAVYSGGMMLVQATGSVVVGTLVDRGMSYDAVFTRLALGLGAVVLLLVVLQLTGRLDRPGRQSATAE